MTGFKLGLVRKLLTMEQFVGKWEVTANENMEEMLKAFGKFNVTFFF